MSWYDSLVTLVDKIIESIKWIEEAGLSVYDFLASLVLLTANIISLIIGVFYSVFNTNVYAGLAFSIITIGISIVIFLRVWNILAGITIFGWQIPKL